MQEGTPERRETRLMNFATAQSRRRIPVFYCLDRWH